jgi:hypothetical protein
MNRIDDITATLRSLDPADRHVDPTNARARADLHAILATDPASSGQHAPSPPEAMAGRPRRAARRVALVGGMAAAVAAGMVAMPSLTGGDQAFATWTAVPGDMSAQQRPEAAADCRENLEDGAGGEHADHLESAETAIAESRGVWTTVVLAGTDGFSAMCITDDSSHLFGKAMIGSVGAPTDYDAPGPRELFATDLGVGSMNGRDISLAAGHAGSNIVGVVYPSRAHGDVAATVSHGQFALWLPGDELMDASSNGVEVEVTYRDGTTATSTLTLG